MSLPLAPYKGTRDFYPEDIRIRDYIFAVWEKTALKYGYEKYDTPIIEPIEIYQAKTSEEIVNEQTYAFTDRGGREVSIRPEMTPSVSRIVAARRQELAYPLRLFSIPNVWRYERPQRGRLREHWQLNIDLFGIDNPSADHEVIAMADAIMQGFKANRKDYTIKINSRALMAYILRDYLKLDQAEASTIVRLLDKKDKMDYGEFTALLSASIKPSERDESKDETLLVLLEARNLDELPPEIQTSPHALKLMDILEALKSQGITNAVFDMSIIRGFMYYTDVVFEVFDNDPANNRSIFGGGRYDGLVGSFGVEPVPTVGFGMGDVVIRDFLETHGLLPKIPSQVHATMVLVGNLYAKALPVINKIREEGVHLSVDSTDRKLEKKLKNVDKAGVRYAIIMGEGELADDRLTLKDMQTGKQEKHSLERTVSVVMDTIAPEDLVD